MNFDDVQQFESFTALFEGDGVKQGNVSDIQPEPAQLMKLNADAPLADEMFLGLLTGSSVGSQESYGVTSASTAL